MNILITGVNGFIGTFLKNSLSSVHKIYGISKNFGDNKNVFRMDLLKTHRTQIEELLEKKKIEVIIHCAASLRPQIVDDFLLNSFIISKFFISPANVKRKYIFIGSAAEYGTRFGTKQIITEKTLPFPESTYGISKLLQTSLALYYKTILECDITVLRLFNILAPGMPANSLVGNIFSEVKKGTKGKVTLNTGEARRDFVDLRDFSDLIEKIITSQPRSFLYNVASGHSVSYKKIVELILLWLDKNGLPTPKISIGDNKEDYIKAECDIEKLKTEFGWAPKYNLEESVIWSLDIKR